MNKSRVHENGVCMIVQQNQLARYSLLKIANSSDTSILQFNYNYSTIRLCTFYSSVDTAVLNDELCGRALVWFNNLEVCGSVVLDGELCVVKIESGGGRSCRCFASFLSLTSVYHLKPSPECDDSNNFGGLMQGNCQQQKHLGIFSQFLGLGSSWKFGMPY